MLYKHCAAKTEDKNAGIVGALYKLTGLAVALIWFKHFKSNFFSHLQQHKHLTQSNWQNRQFWHLKHLQVDFTRRSLYSKAFQVIHSPPPKKSDVTLSNKTLAPLVEQKVGRQTLYHISHCMRTTYPSVLHNCLPSPKVPTCSCSCSPD